MEICIAVVRCGGSDIDGGNVFFALNIAIVTIVAAAVMVVVIVVG
jgi:hypothetical protein